jgi:fluoride exporter
VITAVAFALAAAAGALARAEARRRWDRHDGFQLGTLIVNVTGSFALGLLSEVTSPTITVVGVAGIGAYTTFSSFARDAVALAEAKQVMLAAVYVAGSCLLSVAAAAVGVAVA